MIVLFSDFGSSDLYLGQIKAVLYKQAPNIAVVDLFSDALAYNVCAAAHLLAALSQQFAAGTVFLSVVDPGVGSARAAVVVNAGDKWFVGPDNGLISVAASKLGRNQTWQIVWKPEKLSASFHGRDLFAPITAQIASGNIPYEKLKQLAGLEINFDSTGLNEIIHIDHYGNAFTGLSAGALAYSAQLLVSGRAICYARVYAEVGQGDIFWHENSIGLIEIAANCASAAQYLDLKLGQVVELRV